MAWRRIGDKPLSESMLTRFTDAYIDELSIMQSWQITQDFSDVLLLSIGTKQSIIYIYIYAGHENPTQNPSCPKVDSDRQ